MKVFTIFFNLSIAVLSLLTKLDTHINFTQEEGYYVNAKSGLNYRDAPRGKKLGTFVLNTYVTVVKHTGIFEEITDNGKVLKGEWLGVLKITDTVYVHSAFLSTNFTTSDLTIYYASPYYRDEQGVRQGFVNLSEGFSWEENADKTPRIEPYDLGKDTIYFNATQKQKLLKQLFLSSTDKLYLYNLQSDVVTTYPITDLQMMACVNIYAQGSDNLQNYDYEIGFNLGKKHLAPGDTFAFIGSSNPFQTGNRSRLKWQLIAASAFPTLKNENTGNFENTRLLQKTDKVYKATAGTLTYYVKEWQEDTYTTHRYLMIVDNAINKVVYSNLQQESESTYLIPLESTADFYDNAYQWTGAIFKYKPSVVYGFESASFGCPDIQFVGYKEPPVFIRCNNRH